MGLKVGGCFVLAVVLCSSLVDASGRDLLDSASLSTDTSASSNKKKGKASASTNARSSGGRTTASALANAEAFVEAEGVSKKKLRELFVEFEGKFPDGPGKPLGPYCDAVAAFIDDDVKAVANVYAKAVVNVAAITEVTGVGEACASAGGEIDAAATSLAEVAFEAFALAANDRNVATSDANLKARSQAIARAWASATAQACIESDGGNAFAEAYQDVVAESGAKVVASIVVWLAAEVDCHGVSDSFAEAEVGATVEDKTTTVDAQGDSNVKGKGDASTTADAKASLDQVVPCSGAFKEKCCSRRGRTCLCRTIGCQGPAKKSNNLWTYTAGDAKEVTCSC